MPSSLGVRRAPTRARQKQYQKEGKEARRAGAEDFTKGEAGYLHVQPVLYVRSDNKGGSLGKSE